MNRQELEKAVFEALGAASVCWEHFERAGEFKAQRANEIGNNLLDVIDQYIEHQRAGHHDDHHS